jgi:hypothetical protein
MIGGYGNIPGLVVVAGSSDACGGSLQDLGRQPQRRVVAAIDNGGAMVVLMVEMQ